MATPPRLAEWLLAGLLGPRPSTRFVVGDLREAYRAVRARHTAPLSAAWYVTEALRVALRLRWERRRTHLWSHQHSRSPLLPPGDFMKTELRQALRFLLRRPAFSGAIALTVALAIAATTLAFAVVDGVLLEPLPYREPERLVSVWEHNIPRSRDHNVVSPANFLTWRDELRSFDRVAALIDFSATLLSGGEPERVGAIQTSAAYFEIVGAQPVIGRLYTEEDDVEGANPVVVLSQGYWQRRFGADPAVIGTSIVVDGTARTVLGVLPEQFDFKELKASFGGIGTHDLWWPHRYGVEARQFGGRFLQVVARLAPGATADGAQREASALATRLSEMFQDRQRGWDIDVVPLGADLVGDVRTTILIVFGAVCFVLLIACANVANLLMTRATERQQEMAVRAALGAGRARLVRQQLAESVILSGVGGALGVLLAWWGLRSLVASAPDIPRLDTVTMDASVIGFALLATFATALLFGLAPALHIAGADVAGWLKERTTSGRRGAQRIRGALVVAQVALSLVLLIGAGLLVRSLVNRIGVGVGFDVEQLLTGDISLPDNPYDTPERQSLFFEQLVDRVKTIPGVTDASAIIFPPLTGPASATSFWRLDRPVPEAGQLPTADIRWVHRDYHKVMGIALIAGRHFDERDRGDAPLAILVNETGAKQLWPGEDPIGKRLAMPWGDTLLGEVVGVVGDIRHEGPDTELRAMLYWEHRQFRAFSQMSLVVRTPGEPSDVLPALRAALRDQDPTLPLFNVRSMEELFSTALARARFTAASLGAFALLALILAAIGIYAVVAYATEQRSQEIGIRIALGASRTSVVRMVVAQGLAQIAIALVIGTAGALALSRLLQSLMFEVTTTDPVTFTTMALLLALTALVACWLPARRASSIDPVAAIRHE
jgi:putative ABC transport system permease protein